MALDAHDDGLLSVDGFRIDLRREERKMSNAWREGTFIFPSSSSFTFGPYRHSGYKETFFAIKSKRKRGSRVLVLVRQRFCPSHSFADIDKPKICPSSHSPHLHHLLNEL